MNIPMLRTSPLLALLAATPAHAQYDYHDWSTSYSGGVWHFNNTSSAGTISGSSVYPGFQGAPGTWGMPLAITTNNVFTNGMQIHGINALGSSVEFNFSTNYAWGAGGRLIIGNIHNYYEYTLSAWDFNNNPIDVNTWNTIAEYPSTAAGTIGYFSTSTTSRAPAGLSSKFYVYDTGASASGGQGGIVNVGGLTNVGRIRLTLTDSALAPNPQQVDLLFFYVGTPVPAAPAAPILAAISLFAIRRRR